MGIEVIENYEPPDDGAWSISLGPFMCPRCEPKAEQPPDADGDHNVDERGDTQ